MLGISYWVVPIFSSVVWIAMLIAMITYWATTGRPHYVTMEAGQTFPYISDIGASNLQPLFIAMSAVSVVTFDLAFLFERWLRHTGKLSRNTSVWQKLYSGCATAAAIIGAAGLILLTCFNCRDYQTLHDIFLCVFIGGYIISAIFICWEYQRLGIHYRQDSILRISFWVKLAFILVEVLLVIAFGVCSKQRVRNVAAALEWTVAFVYCLYVMSFVIDFLPVRTTKNHDHSKTELQAAEEGAAATPAMAHGALDGAQYYRGTTHAAAQTNGYSNGYTTNGAHGYANSNAYVSHTAEGYPKPAEPAPLTSRNF
ncbi:hypothetical protein ACEQ8H_000229 [Pleosporales sp. CAS-2024a]